MFSVNKFRAKAAEYNELMKTANNQSEIRELQKLENSFISLADNEQWLADHHHQTVQPHALLTNAADLEIEEEQALRCLGAALIMQWNTLPAKLRRELFDNAGAMGDLLKTPALRAQIARFLHKHDIDPTSVSAETSPRTVI